jgi:hypothetical protein
MEVLLEGDSNSQDLEKRHVENKPLLDHVLKSGHVLLDELQNGMSINPNRHVIRLRLN